jgi:hypothetical protein
LAQAGVDGVAASGVFCGATEGAGLVSAAEGIFGTSTMGVSVFMIDLTLKRSIGKALYI